MLRHLLRYTIPCFAVLWRVGRGDFRVTIRSESPVAQVEGYLGEYPGRRHERVQRDVIIEFALS